MRRLARHLLTLASVLSLALCVATCVLWATPPSGRRGVALTAGRGERVELFADAPGLGVCRATPVAERGVAAGDLALVSGTPRTPERYRWERMGIRLVAGAANTAVRLPDEGDDPSTWREVLRLRNGSRYSYPVVSYAAAEVPYWMAAVATAVLPVPALLAAVARARRQRHRRDAGLCLTCGYDLRGSPERCPECGATPLSGNGERVTGSA